MICIYEQGYKDFSTMGLGQLHPASCVVREAQAGVYELELEHPMDETLVYDTLKNGRIIKAPVPAQLTPMLRIKGVAAQEYWTTTAIKSVYSKKSTNTGHMESITKTRTVLTEHVLPRKAASIAMDTEYIGNHHRDTGVIFKKKPVSYTEDVWVAGDSSLMAVIKPGQEFMAVDKSDASWWQVTTADGTTGWIQPTGVTLSRTVQGTPDEIVQEKKIRDQLFRIYRVEKDTDRGEVKAWARHIYYDLIGNVVMDALYEEVTLEEMLPQLQANCSQPDHGFTFYTDTPDTVLTELEYTHKNMVEAHLDPDDGILKKGNLRMVRDNYDVYFTARSQTIRAPLTYGRNLLGVSLEINEDGVVNRIIPIGKNKDGDPVIPDQQWVNSPNLGDGDLIRAKAIEYSDAQEKEPREATEESPAEPGVTLEQVKLDLIDKAYEDFEKGIDLPEIELTVDFIQLGDTEEYAQYRELDRLYLSDLVQITDLVHGIDVEAEVTEYEYDCLTERYTKIKVGVTNAGRTIGTVDSFMLPNGGIGGTKLARGGVDASRLQNLSVTSAKIGTAQILLAHIAQAAIDQLDVNALQAVKAEITRLVAGEITTDALYAGIASIAEARISEATIGTAQIEDAAITTAKIQLAAITSALIAEGAVQTAHITDGSITNAKIQNLSANKITSGTLDAALANIINIDAASITVGKINGVQIANGAVDMQRLAQGVIDVIQNAQDTADGKNKVFYRTSAPATSEGLTVGDTWFDTDGGYAVSRWSGTAWVLSPLDTAAFAAGSITTEKLATGAVNADKIAANAITAAKIAAGIINSTHIGANTITGDRLAIGTVGTTYIANGAITTDKLLALSVTAGKIAADAVTSDKILAGAVTTAKLDAYAVTAGKIAAGAIETSHISSGARDSLMLDAQNRINVTVGGVKQETVNLWPAPKAGYHVKLGAFDLGKVSNFLALVNGIECVAINIQEKTDSLPNAVYYPYHAFKVGIPYTFSVWARINPSATSSTGKIRLYINSYVDIDITKEWKRVSITQTAQAIYEAIHMTQFSASVQIQVALPQLEIGDVMSPWTSHSGGNGVNLYPDSGAPYRGAYAYNPVKTTYAGRECLSYTGTNDVVAVNALGKTLTVGEVYTVSFWAAASDPLTLSSNGVYLNSGNRLFLRNEPIGKDWKRYEFTFVCMTSGTNVHLHMYPQIDNGNGTYKTFYLAEWKLEQGGFASPWTPAGEDPASGVKTTYMEMLNDLFKVYTGGRIELLAGSIFKLLSGSGTNYLSFDNSRADGCFLFFGGESPETAPAAFWRDGTIKNVANSYVQTAIDNADATNGVVMDFVWSSDVTAIDKVLLSVKLDAFRAYSTGAASGGGSTSGSGGGSTLTSGNCSDVTGSWSGQTTAASGASTGGASNGSTGSASGSGEHTHTMGHTHSISVHTHGMNGHTHSMNGHSHSVSVPSHTHSTPAHNHGIVYGIYKGTTPTSVTVLVDGTAVWSGQSAFFSRDIASYFSKTSGKITRDVMHTVEVRPNTLGRVSLHAYIKTTEISKVAGTL